MKPSQVLLRKYYLIMAMLLGAVCYASPTMAAAVAPNSLNITQIQKTELLIETGRYRRWRPYRYRYLRRPQLRYGRRCRYWRFRCRQNWYRFRNIRGCLRYHGC